MARQKTLASNKLELGTMPVFLTSIATILGAILFLRFGFAVAHASLLGTLFLVILAHLVTIPTALAVSEIATNQKVEGGGLYYIISRSFGLNIGAAIGIALFLSQAISTAFYVIAFSEAFSPILEHYGYTNIDKRLISAPAMFLITAITLWKGADIGLKSLYLVIAILAVSLGMFFVGQGVPGHKADFSFSGITDSIYDHPEQLEYLRRKGVEVFDNYNFFQVFAICFPAFTGIAAGIGLSGDLRDPKRAIPVGTLAATILGMVIYAAVAVKIFAAAPMFGPQGSAENQFVMGEIATWKWIIPIGLAAGTLSSAIGSILIAPRTLQAIGNDEIFLVDGLNSWLAKGTTKGNEPFNSAIITAVIGFGFVAIGEVNVVAEIITMFFMVTYGAICVISFLEHFAADPSYRPTFRSRWYISLVGAILCLWLMFMINTGYALLAITIMAAIYISVTYNRQEKRGMAVVFQGVMFQISRRLQLTIQKSEVEEERWRPAVVFVTRESFSRFSGFEMLSWISHKYGFGTYIHLVEGYLSKNTNEEAKAIRNKLVKMAGVKKSNVFIDTLVSPSYTSAIAQIIQLPGISGQDNNMLMFEFSKNDPSNLDDIVGNFQLTKSIDFDISVLATSEKGFGFRKEIHIWITTTDLENANLMILMGYILLGHPEWKNGQIKIFAIYPKDELEEQQQHLQNLISTGRLSISASNVNVIEKAEDESTKSTIMKSSQDADLTILGFRSEVVRKKGKEIFLGYDGISNVLFINTETEKEIKQL